MRGYDAISELYYGNINPSQRGYHENSDLSIALESFSEHEQWIRNCLGGEARKRFDELIQCGNTVNDIMSLENFRTGFQLGVMLMIDAVSPNESTLYDL